MALACTRLYVCVNSASEDPEVPNVSHRMGRVMHSPSLSVSLPLCPCLSLSVHVSPSLSVSLPLCPCLSLAVRVSPSPSVSLCPLLLGLTLSLSASLRVSPSPSVSLCPLLLLPQTISLCFCRSVPLSVSVDLSVGLSRCLSPPQLSLSLPPTLVCLRFAE